MKRHPINVLVHDGAFHADELICLVLAEIENPECRVDYRRSRNIEDYEWADLVMDVGGRYDGNVNVLYCEDMKWFDHHQENIPVYENGIKMAACGLYLKHMTKLTNQEKDYLLKRGLYAVQADDNGQSLKELNLHLPNPFTFVSTFNCDWKTGVYGQQQEEGFKKALCVTAWVVRNLLREARLEKEAHDQTELALGNMKNHVVVIGSYCPHMTQVVEFNAGEPNVLVTVFSNSQGQWNVQVVPKETGNFASWVSIPEEVSELPGFVFRHKGAFIAGFTNVYDAIKAANLAVATYSENENETERSA